MFLLLLACASDDARRLGGLVAHDVDADGDGFLSAEDCDDQDPSVHPDAPETPYNGVDDDCDGSTPDNDLDGDGWGVPEDCADDDPGVHPDAEDPDDGFDANCDGVDSCGDRVWWDVPVTLVEDDARFFCERPYNASTERVSAYGPDLSSLQCLCEVEQLNLSASDWDQEDDLARIEAIGGLEINGGEVSALRLPPTERVALAGLFQLTSLELHPARELRLVYTGLEVLEAEVDEAVTLEANALEFVHLVVGPAAEISIQESAEVSLEGERCGGLTLRSVTGFQSELVETGTLRLIATNLNDLSGLESVERGDGDLVVRENPHLTLAAIDAFVDGLEVTGEVSMQDNGP